MIQSYRSCESVRTAHPPRKQPRWRRTTQKQIGPEVERVALLVVYRSAYMEWLMADMPKLSVGKSTNPYHGGRPRAAKGQGV